MGHSGCAGYNEKIGRSRKQPYQSHLHGLRVEGRGDVRLRLRLDRHEAAQGEEGHTGNIARSQAVDQRVIFAMCEIIRVLHADDGGDFSGLRP